MFLKLADIKEILKGSWLCRVEEDKLICPQSKELKKEYSDWCVASISSDNGCIILELKPWPVSQTVDCSDEDWYKEHIKQFGAAPTFF